MLYRIKFRRIRRQIYETNIIGDFKFSTSMPTGAVQNHDHAVTGVPCGNFIQKYLHTISIDVWKNQRIHCAVIYRNSSVSISIFLTNHCLANRTNGFRAPTISCGGNTPKTSFIHKHQADGDLFRPIFTDFGNCVREFFFQAS